MENQEDMDMSNLIPLNQHKNVFNKPKILKLKKKLLMYKYSKRKLIVKIQEKIFISKIYQIKINFQTILKNKLKML